MFMFSMVSCVICWGLARVLSHMMKSMLERNLPDVTYSEVNYVIRSKSI